MASAHGYSGTPLAKKLGIQPDSTVCAIDSPDHYRDLLDPLPENVQFSADPSVAAVLHLFCYHRDTLQQEVGRLRHTMRKDAALWVSWPKKASKVPTDITEGTIRDVALPIGLVDVKVCAVDAVWSGLKLVIRKELR